MAKEGRGRKRRAVQCATSNHGAPESRPSNKRRKHSHSSPLAASLAAPGAASASSKHGAARVVLPKPVVGCLLGVATACALLYRGARPKKAVDETPITLEEARQLVADTLGENFVELSVSGSAARRRWTPEELQLLKTLWRRKLSHTDMSNLMHRPARSVVSQLVYFRHPSRYKKTVRGLPHLVSPPWPQRVLSVLRDLPNQEGTSAQVFEAASKKWSDMSAERTSGRLMPQWHGSALGALGRSAFIVKIKRPGERLLYKLKPVESKSVLEELDRLEREKAIIAARAKRARSKPSLDYARAFR